MSPNDNGLRLYRIRHLADGLCPAISNSGFWCMRLASHVGTHGSPRTPNIDQAESLYNPSWVEWGD